MRGDILYILIPLAILGVAVPLIDAYAERPGHKPRYRRPWSHRRLRRLWLDWSDWRRW